MTRALALALCLFAVTPTLAQDEDAGADGAAQRIPFSDVERGSRPLRQGKIEPYTFQPREVLTPEVKRPAEPAPEITAWPTLERAPVHTLEEEIRLLIEQMRQAAQALVGFGERNGEEDLRGQLRVARDAFADKGAKARTYLGRGELTDREWEVIASSYHAMFERAATAANPQQHVEAILAAFSEPGLVERAIAETQRARATATEYHANGPISAKIHSPSSAAAERAEAGGYERLPTVGGDPNLRYDPSTGQYFERVGNYWVPR